VLSYGKVGYASIEIGTRVGIARECSRVLVAGLKDRPVTQGMKNTLPLAAVENIGQ